MRVRAVSKLNIYLLSQRWKFMLEFSTTKFMLLVSATASLINSLLVDLSCSILLMALSSKKYVHNKNKRNIYT